MLDPRLGTQLVGIVAAAVMVASSAAADPARRVALVIGNQDYVELAPLAQPYDDASTIATSLQSLGFEVSLVLNGAVGDMQLALRDFGDAATDAELALFYYSGHAVQFGGENFLLPTSASIGDSGDLPYEAIELSLVMREVRDAAPDLGVVLLDASRGNELPRLLARAAQERGRTVEVGPGIAALEPDRGFIVVSAVTPGHTTNETDGAHSPFTSALVNWLTAPGIDVVTTFNAVARTVMAQTNHAQVPWVAADVVGSFYFNAASDVFTQRADAAPAPGALDLEALLSGTASADQPVAPEVIDLIYWTAIEGSDNPDYFASYLTRFPEGLYADLARSRLDALGGDPSISVAVETVTPESVASEPDVPFSTFAEIAIPVPDAEIEVAEVEIPAVPDIPVIVQDTAAEDPVAEDAIAEDAVAETAVEEIVEAADPVQSATAEILDTPIETPPALSELALLPRLGSATIDASGDWIEPPAGFQGNEVEVDVDAPARSMLVGPALAIGAMVVEVTDATTPDGLDQFAIAALDGLEADIASLTETGSAMVVAFAPPQRSWNEMVRIQRSLGELGLYLMPIDGRTGWGTESAIRVFQRQLGEPETGLLTVAQEQRLHRNARAYGTCTIGVRPQPPQLVQTSGIGEDSGFNPTNVLLAAKAQAETTARLNCDAQGGTVASVSFRNMVGLDRGRCFDSGFMGEFRCAYLAEASCVLTPAVADTGSPEQAICN